MDGTGLGSARMRMGMRGGVRSAMRGHVLGSLGELASCGPVGVGGPWVEARVMGRSVGARMPTRF